jgi:hypothetical protein
MAFDKNMDEWVQDFISTEDEVEEHIELKILYEAAKQEIEEEKQKILGMKHGGSRKNRRPNIERGHVQGHARIWNDYIKEDATYADHFRRRFRMRKELFLRIHDKIVQHNPYFQQKPDAARRPGISSLQKILAAFRMLSGGVTADFMDEYVRIAESTAQQSFKEFVSSVVDVFGTEYLRQPTREDITKQLSINNDRGFPGMFGSIDCTHWVWKNCPVAWQGQY